MVVGSGLLGGSMSSFSNNEDILIFASGVSNSKETNENEYLREFNLLKTFIGTEKKIIYFSTCSVLYECLQPSKYIIHKKNIENFIKNNFKNYLIFRLPNVVGNTNNKHTSFNFFKNNLLNNLPINVEKNSTRYFIDVDDVADSTKSIILDKGQNKKEINVCFNNKIDIFNFINLMSEQIGVNPVMILSNNGCSHDIDNTDFINQIDKKYKEINKDYNLRIIKKYC
jgi:nucleoside-diphosphate-sugar epimerase